MTFATVYVSKSLLLQHFIEISEKSPNARGARPPPFRKVQEKDLILDCAACFAFFIVHPGFDLRI